MLASPLSPLVSSPAELALMLLVNVGRGALCVFPSFFLLFFYSKCGVCAFPSHSLYVSTVGLSDQTFTVPFVQLCLVPCDVLTVLNHVLFPSPARFSLDGLSCSNACKHSHKPLRSLKRPSTPTACKPPGIHFLFHLQPFISPIYPLQHTLSLFQQSTFAFC